VSNRQTNPWTFTNADQATTVAITSIVRNGTASALVTATAHGLLENAPISIQGASPLGWNGGYRIKAVPSANTFLINIPEWKSNLANAGAAGNVLSAEYLDLVRAEQLLWDTVGAGPLLVTNLVGNIIWNPQAVAGQGPYTYGKTFFVDGLVLNTIPSGTLQITVV
jgi:hypothetical protein